MDKTAFQFVSRGSWLENKESDLLFLSDRFVYRLAGPVTIGRLD